MTSRRSAIAEAPNTIASSAPALSTSSSARATGSRSCGTRRSATIVAPAGASRSAVIFKRLLDDFAGKPGQNRGHHTDFAHAIWRNPQQRFRRRRASASIARPAADRKWNDFHGRDHFAGNYRFEGRQVANVMASSTRLRRSIGILVENEHARRLCKQIGAAGERAVDMHALAGDRLGDLGSGDVFGDVAGFKPRDDDFFDAGRLQRRDLHRRRSACLF